MTSVRSFVDENVCCYEDDSRDWEGTEKIGGKEKKPLACLEKRK